MTDGSRDEGRQARGLALAYPERCERGKQHRSKGGWYASKRALCRRFGQKEAQGARKAYGFVALVVLLFALAYPARGYAIDNNIVIYGPTAYVWQDSTYYEIGVVAENKYDAALVALGYDPSNNDMFTAEVKAKLSNESTALGFYNFAQRFTNPPTDGGTLTQTGIQPGFWATAYAIYGAGRIWHAQYESADRLAAKLYVEFVLQGGTGNPEGGGTSGGGSGGEVTIPDRLETNAVLNWRYNATEYHANAHQTIVLGTWLKGQIQSYVASYPVVIPFCGESSKVYSSSNWNEGCGVIMCEHVPTIVVTSDNNDGTKQFKLQGAGKCRVYLSGPRQYLSKTGTAETGITFTFPTSQYGSWTSDGPDIGLYWIGNTSSSGNTKWFAYNTAALAPSIPDTNWPEPDDPLPEPDPPEVPDVPDEDPITQPNPTNPTVPTQPTDPVGGTPPQYDPISLTTEPTYQTPDLSAVLDAMNQHCIHLQNAIHTMGDDLGTYLGTIITQQVSRLHDMVYDNLGWIGGLITSEGQSLRTNIYGNIGWLGDTMSDEFGALKDYLQQLFTWLGEQLNYEVNVNQDSYDDSSVLYWLKRIWAKLGSGDIDTRPVDPVADPWDFGDWLKQLWANFTAELIGMGQDLLADLAQDLHDLVTKFPFCIPWDIAALLALLAAEPVAPSITWPWYTVGANGQLVSTNITVDLSDYDEYFGGVRLILKLLFVGLLLMRTKDDIQLMFSGGLDA